TATAASGVGTYPITAGGAVSANTNYTITYVTGTLTVTPAVLTITANNETRTYGAANPALTVSYSGFVNGDTAASLTTLPSPTTTRAPRHGARPISRRRRRPPAGCTRTQRAPRVAPPPTTRSPT